MKSLNKLYYYTKWLLIVSNKVVSFLSIEIIAGLLEQLSPFTWLNYMEIYDHPILQYKDLQGF